MAWGVRGRAGTYDPPRRHLAGLMTAPDLSHVRKPLTIR